MIGWRFRTDEELAEERLRYEITLAHLEDADVVPFDLGGGIITAADGVCRAVVKSDLLPRAGR
jgi:hypothetical protein